MRRPSALRPVFLFALLATACGDGAPPKPASPDVVGTWRVDREATRARFLANALEDLERRAETLPPEDVERSRAFLSTFDPTREGDEAGTVTFRADGTATVAEATLSGTFEATWTLTGGVLWLTPRARRAAAILGGVEGDTIHLPTTSTEAPYEAVLRRQP
jgi:hypothetical protein